MALVDIIIRAKDGAGLTLECCNSIWASMCREDYRIIVVQSGEDVIPSTRSKNGVVCVHRRDPMGAVTATNVGLGVSFALPDSEYVLIMDNDAMVPVGDTGWLGRMIAELNQYPNTACVGATSRNVNHPQHILSVPQTYTGNWGDEKRGGDKDNPTAVWFVSFCVLFKKSVLCELGLWDTRYDPGNFEDTDYAMKVREAGYEIRVARSVYIHHKGHATFGDDMPELMRGNQAKFAEKWGMGRLWDMGVVPSKDMAILAGRRAGIVREEA